MHGAGRCRQVDHRGGVRDPPYAGQGGNHNCTGVRAVLPTYPRTVRKVVDVQGRRLGAWAIADQWKSLERGG